MPVPFPEPVSKPFGGRLSPSMSLSSPKGRSLQVSLSIRHERERLGLSQEALAERIYVSRQTVSNWETGKTYPDIESLLLMAEVFDVSLDSLVKGDEVVMEETIERDRKRMNRAGWLAVASFVIGVIGFGITLCLFLHEKIIVFCGFLWFLAFWAASLIAAWRIERLKRDNNLVTYGEVLAFMNHGERRTDAAARLTPKWQRNLLSGVAGALVGVLLSVFLLVTAGVIRFG